MPHDPRHDHPFGPPAVPTEVYCLHCGQVYESWQMQFVPSIDANGQIDESDGDWVCPVAGCDGVGFCFDIWPTDPEWTNEFGERVCFFDDGEEFDENGEPVPAGEYDEIEDDDGDPDLCDPADDESEWSPESEAQRYGLIDDREIDANWGNPGGIFEEKQPRPKSRRDEFIGDDDIPF